MADRSKTIFSIFKDIFTSAFAGHEPEGVGVASGEGAVKMVGPSIIGSSSYGGDMQVPGMGVSPKDLPMRETGEVFGAGVDIYSRRQRYSQYEMLEDMIAEVDATLNTYADEASSYDENDHTMRVKCNDSKIKEEAEFMLFKCCKIDNKIWGFVRNLCRDGDLFLEGIIDENVPELGILGIQELDPGTMWRIQSNRGKLLEFQQSMYGPDYNVVVKDLVARASRDNKPDEFIFWSHRSSKQPHVIRFAPAQILHMRIGGRKRGFYPYGVSILAPARRPALNLKLMEDAMLVYRVSRAAERRVYYIDVGSLAGPDVNAFVKSFQDSVKRKKVYSERTQSVDEMWNPMPVRRTTPVPLLDGRAPTIEELAREFEAGKVNWVYSVLDQSGGHVVPGKIVWCGKNYRCNNMRRIWFDDGGYVDFAPEHPLVMRDGSKKRADELVSGDSVMPLYTKLSTKKDNGYIIGYPMLLDNQSGKWKFVHRVVAKEVLATQQEIAKQQAIDADSNKTNHYLEVHHRDFNKVNAHPDNLEWIGDRDHRKFHMKLMMDRWTGPDADYYRRKHGEILTRYNKSEAKRLKTIEDNKKHDKGKRLAAMYNRSKLHEQHNAIRRHAVRAHWADTEKKAIHSKALRWIIPTEVMEFVFEAVKTNPRIGKIKLTAMIRSDQRLMNLLREANAGINIRKPERFHVYAVVSKLKHMGLIENELYSEMKQYVLATESIPLNHQVVRVETLEDEDDVYCMTVVGPNGEEDRHNFAVHMHGSNSSIFCYNSIDDDLFLPVRPSGGTRVETLPGACLALDTRIPLLDGRVLSLSEMIAEHEAGKQNWVYSCDPDTGHIVPGIVSWAGVTRHNAEVLKITLDNGQTVICTPDHKFPVIDKGFVEAKDLAIGESMIPFNTRQEKINHKIVSIETLEQRIDTGTLTIDTDETYHNYHTFALESGIFVKNSNLSEIDDTIYFRKKFYISVKIPPGFLDQTVESQTNRLTLTSIDMRFAKVVLRIQKELSAGFTELCHRHFELQKTPRTAYEDLEVIMTPSSDWKEMARSEVVRDRVERAMAANGLNMFDDKFIMIEYLKMPEDQAEEQIKMRRKQEIEKAEVAAQVQMVGAKAQMEVDRANAVNQARSQQAVAELGGATAEAPGAAPGATAPTEEEIGAALPPEGGTMPPETIPAEETPSVETPALTPSDREVEIEDRNL